MTMWYEIPGVAARFDSKVQPSGDCLVWTRATIKGYGAFGVPQPYGKIMYAHRLAVERAIERRLEPRELILHSCDNPPCVNLAHLRIGNQAENVADAVQRNRVARGDRCAGRGVRLTEQNVREIAALLRTPGAMHKDIATRYGVSRSAITQINMGRAWAWLTGFNQQEKG
jgi:hypothetical protein